MIALKIVVGPNNLKHQPQANEVSICIIQFIPRDCT